MQVKVPSGIDASTSLRLFSDAPTRVSQWPRLAWRRTSGSGIWRRPTRYWPVRLSGAARISGRRAFGHHQAAVDAGARAHVDHVVGLADRVLVVLDHDHRVAEVAQVLERLEQAVVVALVEPDRGLVEHVEHAGEARADLRGEPDALALAARQRAGIARERQIAEADVLEEAEALVDLLEDPAPRSRCAWRRAARGSAANQAAASLDRELGHLADVAARRP